MGNEACNYFQKMPKLTSAPGELQRAGSRHGCKGLWLDPAVPRERAPLSRSAGPRLGVVLLTSVSQTLGPFLGLGVEGPGFLQ